MREALFVSVSSNNCIVYLRELTDSVRSAFAANTDFPDPGMIAEGRIEFISARVLILVAAKTPTATAVKRVRPILREPSVEILIRLHLYVGDCLSSLDARGEVLFQPTHLAVILSRHGSIKLKSPALGRLRSDPRVVSATGHGRSLLRLASYALMDPRSSQWRRRRCLQGPVHSALTVHSLRAPIDYNDGFRS